MTEPIRVLVADDHPTVRAGVRALLELSDDRVKVIGEVATSDDAIRVAEEEQPDVVIMDLRMPGVGGVEATREVVGRSPHIAVLVLTMDESTDAVFAAIRAGARGYLVKESGSAELARAVQAVARGEFITSPAIAKRISAFFAGSDRSSRAPEAFPVLTAREREILDLIAQGRNNAFLAHHLRLSPKTVRNHISNIFAKLHVADRAEAIVRAREAGLGGATGTAGGRW
ncbi:response regulator transcription factor [Amorphoplanes nipponensis]|uniref:DNA-binding response regulator n=1 Tax=Actinoplanes nipponensis TaxID=135950 RepID=A0A919JCQ3_9ACTN|nr:response regulator transcription factor [Actinoplanes nipponensis]GIE47177.1 DNA-binding response regulator [Actinoplanes nipponensis]